MISKVWNFLFKSHIMTWKYNISIFMASDFLEVFIFDSDSVWVSSQVLIICHDNSIVPYVHDRICNNQKPWTQQFKHVQPHGQINQAQFNSLFIMSPSDLLATPVSECLQERCSPSSLRDIWKLKNLKRLTTYKHVWQASAFTNLMVWALQYFQNLSSTTIQFQIVPSGIAPF